VKRAHETLPLRDLIDILHTLCSERRTGTMFVHTDTNRSARIGIKQGRIFFVAFGRFRGMDAIEQIKLMQYGRYSFTESVFNGGLEIPLPPTGELLTELAWSASGDPRGTYGAADTFAASTSTPASPLGPGSPTLPVPPPVADADLSIPGAPEDRSLRVTGERLYDLVAETLALSIGPIAPMVCADYRDRLAALSRPSEYRPLIKEIASELGRPEESKRFIARALAAVGL
jgi:hypothetical protein